MVVGVVESICHRCGNVDRFIERELSFTLETRPQRLALDERHHVKQDPLGVAAVEKRQEIRVLKPGSNADLSEEAVSSEHRAELGVQDLESNVTVGLEIAREIHRGHPAFADQAFDVIAVGECTSYALEGVSLHPIA